jgi:4'-phosphopantetheinyl transferase
MNPEWLLPPEPLRLKQDEVHVWRFGLSLPPARLKASMCTLAQDELRRAERFHFQRDRDHFIIARAWLRAILARYLGIGADQLRFEYSAYGKPELTRDLLFDDTRFNISHSHGLALLAITRGRQVGVDLEMIRPGLADETIAEHFFSPMEVRTLRSLPRHQQNEAFFNCWTRKEAFIKAKGEGLSMPLNLFDVTLVPGERAALLKTRGDPDEANRWLLREISPAPGFVGAVAAEGRDWRLKCWDCPESEIL